MLLVHACESTLTSCWLRMACCATRRCLLTAHRGGASCSESSQSVAVLLMAHTGTLPSACERYC